MCPVYCGVVFVGNLENQSQDMVFVSLGAMFGCLNYIIIFID